MRSDIGDYLADIGGLDCKFLPAEAREIKQIVDQPLHALAQEHEPIEPPDAFAVELLHIVFKQEARMVVNAAQRLLQIVRSDIGKIVEFLVAALKRLGVADKFLLGFFAPGDVANDARITGAVFQGEGADRKLDRQCRSILAAR